ncbi:MAG: GTP 3',8-cyclase MoaA [Planctomycetes bacterium]|nr:GTP 3',8-cyclase MoaA [Planctomycetota bacterium]
MPVALPIFDAQPVRPVFAQGPRSLSAVRLLRLSVTDRCNLRCQYCMPEDGVAFSERADLLSAGDIVAVAAAAASVGVDHFKVTGGEPTVRGDLLDIIAGVAALSPRDLSMTTNGMLLDKLAHDLRRAGLMRLTVSCDSLRADRFERIVRGGVRGLGGLPRLMRGLEAAGESGFDRIKINVVVMGGINDDEAADFARLTIDRPWTVRFIEYMPLGESTLVEDAPTFTVDNAQVRRRIEEELGVMTPVSRENEAGVGPADVFTLPGAAGRVGFISAMSRPFCETCNRLRLTATGELRSCLFDGGEVSVLDALQPSPDRARLVEMMRRCVALKPEVHSSRGNRAMNQLGG